MGEGGAIADECWSEGRVYSCVRGGVSVEKLGKAIECSYAAYRVDNVYDHGAVSVDPQSV